MSSFNTCSESPDPAPTPQISDFAHKALDDFKLHLKVLQKDALDEDSFNVLLDDVGYKQDRTGLFENLLLDISNIQGYVRKGPKGKVTADDILALYGSMPYHLLENKDPGDALLKFVHQIFDDIDVHGSGFVDNSKLPILVSKLLSYDPKTEEVQELFEIFDLDYFRYLPFI